MMEALRDDNRLNSFAKERLRDFFRDYGRIEVTFEFEEDTDNDNFVIRHYWNHHLQLRTTHMARVKTPAFPVRLIKSMETEFSFQFTFIED